MSELPGADRGQRKGPHSFPPGNPVGLESAINIQKVLGWLREGKVQATFLGTDISLPNRHHRDPQNQHGLGDARVRSRQSRSVNLWLCPTIKEQ